MKHKYLLFGVLFGLCFPIFGLLIDCCLIHNLDFETNSFINLFVKNPLHYIIITAPFFLGLAFYVAGVNAEKQAELNKHLKRSNDELILSNENLDSFNYHVSHDLKTVLNNTQALSKMIRKYVVKENLQKIDEISEKLVDLAAHGKNTVNTFLDLGKTTSLTRKTDIEDISFAEEVNLLSDIHSFKNSAKISFSHFTHKHIKMNRGAFESIFLNLVTNSMKYSTKFPEIQIKMENMNNGYIRILYTDNGIGVDLDKHKEELFKPFNKIETGLDVESSGVGLFLVKRIINAYGGYLEVESELGKGTTFSFDFPEEMFF